MKHYWFNKMCCVPECLNLSTEGEGCFKEYFDLPAEPQARRKWLTAILTEDGDNLKVCEDHFKEDDVFRDKNNRKKLSVNSVPSMKLPKRICAGCLGATGQSDMSSTLQAKVCKCKPSPMTLQIMESHSAKRTRTIWTNEEKIILFKAIKNHGDVRFGNNNVRIKWANVVSHCRSNGCFGNEKELKSVWQTMRTNATKVFKNDIFGSKLDRKVSKFLYGPSLKKGALLEQNRCSNSSMEIDSTDGHEDKKASLRKETEQILQESPASAENSTMYETSSVAADIKGKEEPEDCFEPDSDEYYSISDVEEIFQIKIRPTVPEVISLLSSDDEK